MSARTKLYEDHLEKFGTLAEISQWMLANNVPLTAELHYAGCGSHSLEFKWDDGSSTEQEMGYWVHCQIKDHPELAWGWFQDHEPTKTEIENERIENHPQEVEVTWSFGPKSG